MDNGLIGPIKVLLTLFDSSRRMRLIFCLVFIGVCFEGARSLPPPSAANLRLYLTMKGADYANVLMVNKTKSTIEGQKVPPVSITKTIFWWNTVRLSLSNSKIRSVKLGSTSIQFEKGYIKVLIKINAAEVAGEYKYNGGILGSGRGSYTVKLKNVWINKHVSVGVNAMGKPFIINGQCSNWIEETSPDFSGGASFVINLLVALAKSSVDNDVRKKICTSINEAVEKRGEALPKYYPDNYNISRVECAQINVPILQQPIILTSHMEFLMEGRINSTCYQLNNSSRERGVHHIKYTPNPSKMISTVLSDRFINSVADLYHKAGLMDLIEIKSKDVLDPLRVALHLTSPPRINTTLNSSLVVFKMKANLTTTSSVDKTSRTFSVNLDITGDFYLEEEKREFLGKVKNLRFEPVFTNDIPEKIKSLVLPVLKTHDNEIIKQLNGFFDKIAPLPTSTYIQFTSKHFLHKEGYTVFESDVKV